MVFFNCSTYDTHRDSSTVTRSTSRPVVGCKCGTYFLMPRDGHSSLHEPRCRLVCAVLLALLFIAGLTVLVLWLILHPRPPVFHLAKFSLPSGGNPKSGGQLADLTVHFAITVHNPNRKTGIDYGEIVTSVLYEDEVVAWGTMDPFYQPPNADTTVVGNLTVTGPVPKDPAWEQFASHMFVGNPASMRLMLDLKVRFPGKLLWDWNTNHHRMIVVCYLYPRVCWL